MWIIFLGSSWERELHRCVFCEYFGGPAFHTWARWEQGGGKAAFLTHSSSCYRRPQAGRINHNRSTAFKASRVCGQLLRGVKKRLVKNKPGANMYSPCNVLSSFFLKQERPVTGHAVIHQNQGDFIFFFGCQHFEAKWWSPSGPRGFSLSPPSWLPPSSPEYGHILPCHRLLAGQWCFSPQVFGSLTSVDLGD